MKKLLLVIMCLSFSLGGCTGLINSTISGGQNPGLPSQVPMGESISAQRQSFTTTKPFPLKIVNMELMSALSKDMKLELEQYFVKRGDYPEINIQIRPAMPEMDNGFSGGYHAFTWKYNYEADLTIKDWENPTDIIFDYSTRTIQVVASTKAPIGATPDVMGIMKRINDIGYHNLAVDIVSQLDARRAEIEKMASRFTAWKSGR